MRGHNIRVLVPAACAGGGAVRTRRQDNMGSSGSNARLQGGLVTGQQAGDGARHAHLRPGEAPARKGVQVSSQQEGEAGTHRGREGALSASTKRVPACVECLARCRTSLWLRTSARDCQSKYGVHSAENTVCIDSSWPPTVGVSPAAWAPAPAQAASTKSRAKARVRVAMAPDQGTGSTRHRTTGLRSMRGEPHQQLARLHGGHRRRVR